MSLINVLSNNFYSLLQSSQNTSSGIVIFIIIGAVCVFIGVILFILRKKTLDAVLEMKYIQTSQVKNILENYNSISKDLGKGNYSELVEVKGVSKSNKTIKSQHTGTDCVWYRSQIIREYEETVTVRDSDGRSRTENKRGSETVSDVTNSVPFEVDDQTGSIQINPDSADIISKQIYDNFQPGEYRGSFQITMGHMSGRRTIGYRLKEDIIPLNQNLYVFGEASDKEGKLEIKKPSDKKKKFIVSVKSEEELIKSYSSKATVMLVAGIILPIAGIGIILFGIFGNK